MKITPRFCYIAGALAAAVAVGAGAFGAHTLKALVAPERLDTFKTAAQYQMYHALALLFVGWMLEQNNQTLIRWAAGLLLVGMLLFSGSLYVLVLADTAWLGAITPLGGVAFIAGWLCLAFGALRHDS